jgi:dipeptidyl aminopeptidase/acylaminoacyl peptidase
MVRLPVAAFFALSLLGVTAQSGFTQQLDASAQAYLKQLVPIAAITSRDSVTDYYQRLIDDKDWVNAPTPKNYTPADWDATVNNVIGLDLSVASQLLARTFRSMSEIQGLGEAFVRSSRNGKMQPVAVYVPKSYVPGHPTPLVVFLHGRGQSETELLGQAFIIALAERTGAIVVAPYGRGHYDFSGTESDVYDAYDAAVSTFTIDPRRRYLAGYSMGAFSTFNIAPMHPNDWTAIMSISGALLNSRADRLVAMMPQTPVYVLTGTLDDNVPTQFSVATAIYLRNRRVPVTFYAQPDGTHRLISLLPILTQAWDDMAQGIVRTPTIAGDFTLPGIGPARGLQP